MTDFAWQRALARLLEGNARFQSFSQSPAADDPHRRAALAEGQNPFAALLSCADSRVAPELIFAQGLGDLFVVRVAGNVLDNSVLGSLEYAVTMLQVPLLIVLGHSGCGAVTASLSETVPGGAVGDLVQRIAPALRDANLPAEGPERVDAAARANARHVARALREALPGAAGGSPVRVLPAFHSLADGSVELLEPAR